MSSPDTVRDTHEVTSALHRFLEAVDQGRIETVLALYHSDFCCVRIASVAGAVARIDRAGMIAIWRSQVCAGGGNLRTGPVASTPTEMLLVEARGGWGVALLLRDKNFGPGSEKVFYSLIWRHCGGEWLLWREFVQQQHVPAWAKGGAA